MAKRKPSAKKPGRGEFLDGQLLVAMPSMPDERFARSVIYLCAHSEDGAMGIVINHKAPAVTFPELLVQLDVINSKEAIRLPREVEEVQVLRGGPMETGRGFVLHSDDFRSGEATVAIDKGVCLTATLDILRAIAHGQGRIAQRSRSATPAGGRANSRTNCCTTAG